MNWKIEYQLLDMSTDQILGFTCKKCGLYQPKTVANLLVQFDRQAYPSHVEQTLKCIKWGCGGALRLELTHNIKLEGFQGGLA